MSKYNEGHDDITMIFMDIQMPVMDGLQATQAIRQLEKENGYKPATIIGLSGNSSDTDRDLAINAGMNRYLIKPCDKEVLKSIVGQVPIDQIAINIRDASSPRMPG